MQWGQMSAPIFRHHEALRGGSCYDKNEQIAVCPLCTYAISSCSIPEVDEEHVPGVGTGGGHMLRMEDCEAFKCEVVSLGRKAYEMVSKGLVGGPHDED